MAHDAPSSAPRPAGEVPVRLRTAAAWSWRILAVLGIAAIAIWLAWHLRAVTIPLFLSVLFATLLLPLTDLLHRRGLPRWLAVLISMLLFVAVLAGVAALIVGSLIGEAGQLGALVSAAARDAGGWIQGNDGPLSFDAGEVGGVVSTFGPDLEKIGSSLLRGVAGETSALASTVAGLVLALAFLIYVLADAHGIREWALGQLPPDRRPRTEEALRVSWASLSGFVRGTVVISIWDTILIGIAIVALGLPIGGSLIVLTFFAAFVPILGAWVAAIVVVLVALTGGGVDAALIMIAVEIVVHGAESVWIAPVVYRRTVSLHPIVTIAAVTAGGGLMGVIGAVIAVPVVAVCWAIGKTLRAAVRPA